jgi:hypothetical protein
MINIGSRPRVPLIKNVGLALGAMLLGVVFGFPGEALSAEGGAKGKTVGYVTFGLQFDTRSRWWKALRKRLPKPA